MGIPVNALQTQISSSQFTRYLQAKKQKWQEKSKLEYYLAEMLVELKCIFADAAEQKKIRKRGGFIKFIFGKKAKKPELTEDQKQSKMEASKAAWLGTAGINKNNESLGFAKAKK